MSSSTKTGKQKKMNSEDNEDTRLAKRLCYLLRYGAVKEGLDVYEGGYVDMDQVVELNLMRHDTREEILAEVDSSLSTRGAKRFERKEENGKTLVRACFCVNFEVNPCHSGTNVTTLLSTCLDYVSDNLELFDLEDFPDEYLINNMIHRLKKKKKLNNAAFRQLLVPTLHHLNLDNIYLTEGTLRSVWKSCPHLRILSLKDCGYLMTDNLMEQLAKKLPHLESLNLCACKHLTDRSMSALWRSAKNLKELNLSWIKTISESAIISLVKNCPKLEHLDIYDHKVSAEGVETLTEMAKDRNITIVLKGLTDTTVAPENPCAKLPFFGKTCH
ncbi:uncharacterized protein LOC132558572 [Ylistrum balloti]|uniref:uncharacterized protein LOC132558572 n=1 Tax=Ylistrum balloti TaxID=509963 RepID=UPI002905D035|nr:uncharacterized protein LOC132558572 [Ylistrum balloti]